MKTLYFKSFIGKWLGDSVLKYQYPPSFEITFIPNYFRLLYKMSDDSWDYRTDYFWKL